MGNKIACTIISFFKMFLVFLVLLMSSLGPKEVLIPYAQLSYLVHVYVAFLTSYYSQLNLDMPEGKSIMYIYKKAAMDFMKIWLFVEGPEKILAWAAIKDPEIRWENKYAHHCHACLALYKDDKVRNVLRKYYYEKVEEVLLKYSMMIRAGNLATCA